MDLMLLIGIDSQVNKRLKFTYKILCTISLRKKVNFFIRFKFKFSSVSVDKTNLNFAKLGYIRNI
jgi:hypothetical protein